MFSNENKARVSLHKHFYHGNTYNEYMLHEIQYLLKEQNHNLWLRLLKEDCLKDKNFSCLLKNLSSIIWNTIEQAEMKQSYLKSSSIKIDTVF